MVTTVSSTQSPVSIVVNTTPVTVTQLAPSTCISVLVPAVTQQDCVITKTEYHDKKLSLDPQIQAKFVTCIRVIAKIDLLVCIGTGIGLCLHCALN